MESVTNLNIWVFDVKPMHFFSLFGPTFNINTSTTPTSSTPTANTSNAPLSPLFDQGNFPSVSSDLQSILQTLIPNLSNVTNNTRQREATTTTQPNNGGIIMVYEDLSAQQSTGLSLTDIHEVSHLLLNEKEDETEEQKTCSICQQPIEWDSIIRRINICNHVYHVNCIDQWLVENNTCPTCRRILRPNNEESGEEENNESGSDSRESRGMGSPVSSFQLRIPVRNNN